MSLGGLIGGLAGGVLGIVGGHFGRRARKRQRRLAKARLKHAVSELQRQRASFEEGSERQKQGMIQSLASRGLADSTISQQDLAAHARQRQRVLQGLSEQQSMAIKSYRAFRKGGQMEDMQGLLGDASAIAGAGLAAWQYAEEGQRRQPFSGSANLGWGMRVPLPNPSYYSAPNY